MNSRVGDDGSALSSHCDAFGLAEWATGGKITHKLGDDSGRRDHFAKRRRVTTAIFFQDDDRRSGQGLGINNQHMLPQRQKSVKAKTRAVRLTSTHTPGILAVGGRHPAGTAGLAVRACAVSSNTHSRGHGS